MAVTGKSPNPETDNITAPMTVLEAAYEWASFPPPDPSVRSQRYVAEFHSKLRAN